MQWKKYGKNAQHYKITKNDKKVLDAQIKKMKYKDSKGLCDVFIVELLLLYKD